MSNRWRVGKKLGRTLYDGDELVGLMDTEELARLVVDAVNEQLEREEEHRRPADLRQENEG